MTVKLRILRKRRKGLFFGLPSSVFWDFVELYATEIDMKFCLMMVFFRSQPQIFETEYLLANGTYDACSRQWELGISLEIGSCYAHNVCFNILRLWYYSSKMVLDEVG